MSPGNSRLVSVSVALLSSALAALVLQRTAPPPAADVAAGTESCFGRGLFGRELPPPARTPQRWTTDRAVFRFQDLPTGPARLRVEVHGQRAPVAVAVQGHALGSIPVGGRAAEWALDATAGEPLEIELRVEPFVGWGGRRLGVLLDRIAVDPAPGRFPSSWLLACFLVPALAVAGAALAAGLAPVAASAVAAASSVLQALALYPSGLVRSSYSTLLAAELTGAGAVACAAALGLRRRASDAAPWAFTALFVAALVQCVAATSPVMVVSDAEFHANKLVAVARGGAFPTSITPGAHPFRFPYGVSFYAVLAPLAQAGLDRLLLVRWGAALAGWAASWALCGAMLRWGPRRAGTATLLLTLLPVTFDLYSFGNLSNVFGQAATVAFFAWWWAEAPVAGAVLGAALFAAAGLAHLSSAIVLGVVSLGLALSRGRSLWTDRRRGLALVAGLAAVTVYYAHFLPLVVEQLGRLGGGGEGAPWPAALLRQARAALDQWGAPATLLGAVGILAGRLDAWRPDLRAWGAAGAALALLASVSPLEVRYLYALTLPLAVVAAEGLEQLRTSARWGAVLGGGLLVAQGWLAAQGIVEGVLHRYRP